MIDQTKFYDADSLHFVHAIQTVPVTKNSLDANKYILYW